MDENKVLVRRFLEAHAKGDLAAVEEMLAPSCCPNIPRMRYAQRRLLADRTSAMRSLVTSPVMTSAQLAPYGVALRDT